MVYYRHIIVFLTCIKCFIPAAVSVISHRCDKVTIPTFKMQPSHICSLFIFFYFIRRCEIEFPPVFGSCDQFVSSSEPYHILGTFSCRFLQWIWPWMISAHCWSCTVLKGWQWPGQAVLGGCLYIICQDDMLLKSSGCWSKGIATPLFCVCVRLCVSVPRLSIWGRDELRRSVDAVFYLFLFFPLLL